ncbi:MAG: hypothetical protein HKO57_02415 [Akkermansiaceae bacterium]|nr:hypothetical protein [Akkermansiaceae bacterium]
MFQSADPALVLEMFTYFRETERDVYKSSLASLASSRKLRPVFIQKKPVAEQIAWMHKTLRLRSSDTIGEHLLQVWFMKGHQPMLTEFCDIMGIEHNGEGSVEGELPEDLDAGKLKEAADTLVGSYNPALVSLYLHVFNLQRPGGWESLADLLQDDARIRMAPEEEPPAAEPPAEAAAQPEAAEAAPEETTDDGSTEAKPASSSAPEPAESVGEEE